MPVVSPTAYNLSIYLATFWNASTANGAVHPSEQRIMNSLAMSRLELHNAAQELMVANWWKPVMVEGVAITSWKPLFIQTLTQDDFNTLKRLRTSLNHAKVNARYTPIGNQLSKAIMGWVSERIVPKCQGP